MVAICAAGVLAASLVGYSLIPGLKDDLQMTNCGVYLTLDTAINGDGSWGGFKSLRDKIGNITNLLSAAVTQIQIYFPGDDWLVDSIQAMRTSALDIYNKYKPSQLITPNPDSTATANNAGQTTPLVDSRFIKTGMGPNGTSNTMATDIDLGLRTTKKVNIPLSSCQIKPTR